MIVSIDAKRKQVEKAYNEYLAAYYEMNKAVNVFAEARDRYKELTDSAAMGGKQRGSEQCDRKTK